MVPVVMFVRVSFTRLALAICLVALLGSLVGLAWLGLNYGAGGSTAAPEGMQTTSQSPAGGANWMLEMNQWTNIDHYQR